MEVIYTPPRQEIASVVKLATEEDADVIGISSLATDHLIVPRLKDALRGALASHAGRDHVVGVSGPPGGGKSTLVSALITALRAQGQTVAVVAVDPSSPYTGGAVLGDRIRMGAHQDDPGVFIRSLASRGHPGGLARAAADVVDVFDAAGYDTVIVETVGACQSEVEISPSGRSISTSTAAATAARSSRWPTWRWAWPAIRTAKWRC
jgi:putative protein kinase ArgK-like GTPase of G3E family